MNFVTEEQAKGQAIFVVALFASMFSLAVAYISQYGFGLHPCELCLAQRVPYSLVMVMAILALWKPRLRLWLGFIICLAFLADGGIATYHAAVEKHWIKGPTSCTDTETHAIDTLDDFLKKIQRAPINACDQPQWEYKGFTMASLNAIWAMMLTTTIFAAMQQYRRRL